MLLLHQTAGLLHAGRGRHREALSELSRAEELGSQLADSQGLASRATRWVPATLARLGRTGEARAFIAGLGDVLASSGEMRNASAVICLAEGDPAGALAAVAGVLDGTVPVLGDVTVWRLTCWPGSRTGSLVISGRRTGRWSGRWPWRRRTGWSCRSR